MCQPCPFAVAGAECWNSEFRTLVVYKIMHPLLYRRRRNCSVGGRFLRAGTRRRIVLSSPRKYCVAHHRMQINSAIRRRAANREQHISHEHFYLISGWEICFYAKSNYLFSLFLLRCAVCVRLYPRMWVNIVWILAKHFMLHSTLTAAHSCLLALFLCMFMHRVYPLDWILYFAAPFQIHLFFFISLTRRLC